MRKLFSIILILFTTSCNQNNHSTPMLWKISGNGLVSPSYLFGTFHTKDPRFKHLHKSVISALTHSQRLYTEIPVNGKSSNEVYTFSLTATPSDLKKRLQPQTKRMLLSYLKKNKLPYTLSSLTAYKTWAIGLILANQKENDLYPNTLFMDQRLAKIAQHNDIKHMGLETPLEQLRYFDKLSSQDQEQFLIDILMQENDTRYTNALKSWYLKGEAKGFFKLQEDFASDDPKQKKLDLLLINGLLFDRNKKLTLRIDTLLRSKPKLQYFFAIGAGHMSSEKGIVSTLQKLGYHVEKID